jgi:single-strand DNA-binding protein
MNFNCCCFSRVFFLGTVLLLLCHGPQKSRGFAPQRITSHSDHQTQQLLNSRLYFSEIPNIPFEDDDLVEDDYDADGQLSDEELEATLEGWDDTIPKFNTVHLTGRLGIDPEPRYFDDGKVVVNLSLATQRKYHNMERMVEKVKSGEEDTDWYGLEIWGQTAEFVSKYVDKGMRVGVVGSLQIDRWMDKITGEPRSKAKVIVRDFDILETRAESEARRARSGSGSQRGPAFYRSNNNNNNNGYSGGYNDDNDGGGPSSAGTGGFFD